jgi:putative thioredoxin
MAKVNVDENQAIAGQMQVQSIPTVFAFSNGQPVDGFQGAVSASEIKAFVDRVVTANGGEVESGLDSAVASAEQMLDDGDFEAAIETFSAILEEDANNIKSYIGLIKCHIAAGDLDQAEAILNGIPLEISQSPEIEAVHAQIELAKQARDAGPINELALLVEKNPDDNDARFKLAQALHGAGQVEDAVDQLLELFKRDREWNDGAAKAQLFTIFEALEPNNEIVLNGRRKLSSLIFA